MKDITKVRLPYNTDKVEHGYIPIYREIAKELGDEARVCEIGVFNGGSLEMWQAFFPKGIVVGVDNFEHSVWPEGTVKVVMDQADPKLVNELLAISPQGYDLIVDDGCHFSNFVSASFNNLWQLVKPGGWYVVEDWISAGVDMHKFAPNFVSTFLDDANFGNIVSIEYRFDIIVIRKASNGSR